MRACFLAALTLACNSSGGAVAFRSSDAPGGTLVLLENGIAAAASIAAPAVQAELLALTLPDQKFNEVLVDIHLNGIHVTQVAVSAAASASADGLSATITLSSFHLAATYQAWVMGIAAGSGPCDIDIDATASLTVAVHADCTPACRPHLEAENTQVHVNTVSPVCKGVAGQVLDALVDLFNGAVKQALTDGAAASITAAIDTAANAALANITYDVPIQGGAVMLRFDLSASSPPSASSGAFLALPVLGDAVVAANASTRAPFPPPTLPPGPPFAAACASAYLQLALSEFSLESAGWALWSVGGLQSVVPHTVVPPQFPIQLNTTDVGLLAPGLPKAFPNAWMQLAVSLAAPPAANLTAAGAALAAPLLVDFQALPPNGGGAAVTAFTLGCPLGLALQLGVGGGGGGGGGQQNLTANITSLDCALALANSTVGPVDVKGLALLVNFVLSDVLLPLVNAVLNVGAPLPSLGGLSLVETSIQYAPGLAGLCTNFSYTPPPPLQRAVAAGY